MLMLRLNVLVMTRAQGMLSIYKCRVAYKCNNIPSARVIIFHCDTLALLQEYWLALLLPLSTTADSSDKN